MGVDKTYQDSYILNIILYIISLTRGTKHILMWFRIFYIIIIT